MILEGLLLVPKETDEVSSSKPYFALIYFLINDFKRDPNVEKEFRDQIKKLLKIAEDNFEEKDYLIGEIEALTGEKLDDYFLKLF